MHVYEIWKIAHLTLAMIVSILNDNYFQGHVPHLDFLCGPLYYNPIKRIKPHVILAL